MKVYKFMWLVVVIGILVGCPGDEPTKLEDDKTGDVPVFMPKMVSLPQSLVNDNDSSAEQTVTYIKMIDILFDFREFFIPINGPDSLEWEMSWAVDSMTVTMMAAENDTGYQWTVTLSGTSASRGIVYDNFVLMEMEQNRDGTAGKSTIYNLWTNSNDLLAESYWVTLQDGVTYFETIIYEDGKKSKRIEIVSNLDRSGFLEYYVYQDGTTDLLRFKAEWYIDGSGQCWVYDEMMNVVFHGEW